MVAEPGSPCGQARDREVGFDEFLHGCFHAALVGVERLRTNKRREG
jgi:hypothetical protein